MTPMRQLHPVCQSGPHLQSFPLNNKYAHTTGGRQLPRRRHVIWLSRALASVGSRAAVCGRVAGLEGTAKCVSFVSARTRQTPVNK